MMSRDHGKVAKFLGLADVEWKDGARKARKFGRSSTNFFEQLPIWALFEYTNGGVEDPHVAILEAHWLHRNGGIEKKCTGKYHCPYKKLDCFQSAHVYTAASIVRCQRPCDESGGRHRWGLCYTESRIR